MASLREYNALINKRKNKNALKIVPGSKPPLAPEVEYKKKLQAYIRAINTEIEREIFPLLVELEPLYVQDTPRQNVLSKLNEIKKMFSPIDNYAYKTAREFVAQVDEQNKKRLYGNFKKSFGFSMPRLIREEKLRPALDRHIYENVRLIKSIAPEHLDRVKNVISEGMTCGRTANDIRQEIRQGFGITERRARLIARDQTTKINGNLNHIRAVDAGITRYRWIGRDDALERASHVANNNKIFYWDKPPKTGHPGQDYQCRCYAKLIIDL